MKDCGKRPIALILTAALAGLASGEAVASGFALIEQNGSGVGNAHAGGAAVAEDASTVFYNPAGLSRFTAPQAVVSVNGVDLHINYSDSASQPPLGQTLGSSGGNAGAFAAVPAVYVAWPVTAQVGLGLGVNSPFGLTTEYTSDWIGRFQAIKTFVQTVNVNPSLSFKVNDQLALGIGANYQHVRAQFTNAVDYTAVVAQGLQQLALAGQIPAAAIPGLIAANAGLQGTTKVSGNDSAWGVDLGVLYRLTPQTRIGASYRSTIKYTIKGNAEFNPPSATQPVGASVIAAANAPGGVLSNGGISLPIKLPDSASLSVFHELSPEVDLMADVSWTGWSSIQALNIIRDNGVPLQQTPELWRDTWRFAAGANYHWDDEWLLRAGVAFDQSPVPDAQRTPRLPDGDRTWLAFGFRYKISPAAALDAGYAHLFVKNTNIVQNAGNQVAYGLINGSYTSRIEILSLQLTYNF